MYVPEDRSYMTVDEYLEFEAKSKVRHEYLDGQLFAMTGASLRHNLIGNNLNFVLMNHLKGGRCRSFTFDVKVRIDSLNTFYYPDILVSCTPLDGNLAFLKTPVLIVEILSPSTAAIDRREKLMAYAQIETLKEYALIHQKQKRVELLKKNLQHFDKPEVYMKDSLVLNSMAVGPLTVRIDEIYKDVDWDEPGDPDDALGLYVRETAGELAW
ncbi:MAG: Uma2 family endonuclease [Candidatus Melainabacteria bacterium]|nr:Uma2 family endonuclease [Candidatus Melainabacteria bacterium]